MKKVALLFLLFVLAACSASTNPTVGSPGLSPIPVVPTPTPDSGAEKVTLIINNFSKTTSVLELFGENHYRIEVQPLDSVTIEIVAGKYSYTETSCGFPPQSFEAELFVNEITFTYHCLELDPGEVIG